MIQNVVLIFFVKIILQNHPSQFLLINSQY
jgi:hypothetical protein